MCKIQLRLRVKDKLKKLKYIFFTCSLVHFSKFCWDLFSNSFITCCLVMCYDFIRVGYGYNFKPFLSGQYKVIAAVLILLITAL